MRDIAISIIVFGLLPSVLRRPYIGVLLWSWIGYMNPHRLSWGFAYNFPFAYIIAIATFIGILFSKEPKRIPMTPVVVVLVILNLWFLVTTLFAIYPDAAWHEWNKVIKIQLMVFVTLMIMNDRKRLHALVWVITLSIGFFGVKGGIFTILHGGQNMVLGPPGSFIEGNTEIALALVMILPLMRYLQLNAANKWIQRGLGIAMLLAGLSIIGSYSRGAFLAGAAMAGFLWLKSRNKAWMSIALVIVLPFMFAMMPDKWFSRMGTIDTYQEDASAMGRINAWWFAFNLAKDRPLVGGGFNTFERDLFYLYAPVPEDFHDAHSIYFEMLGEHGFVGLGFFLLVGLLAWRTGSQIIQLSRDHESQKWAYDLASMIQVSLLGYAVGGAFLGLAYFDLFYHLVAILVVTKIVVSKSLVMEEVQANVQGEQSGAAIKQ